jgi:hypothetical protein
VHYSAAVAAGLADVTLAPPALWDFTALADVARGSPHHVLRLLAPSLTGGAPAAVTAAQWLAEGALEVAERPALYRWQWSQRDQSVVGVAGALALPAREVWPHEQVRAGLLAERAAELGTGAVQPEPILLLYDGDRPLAPSGEAGAALVSRGVVDLTLADSRHEVRALADVDGIDQVNAALSGASLVVADGHHRFRVLSSLPEPRPRAFVLVVDVPRSRLDVGPIPRVVPGLGWATVLTTPGASVVELADDHRHRFLGEAPPGRLRWVVADQDRTVGLELTVEAADALGGPDGEPCGPVARDVCHLHRHLLPRWGVPGDRVYYAHSWSTATGQATATVGLAVESRAPRLEDVMAAARSGTLLPHKATSITPKPRTGLLMLGDAIAPD